MVMAISSSSVACARKRAYAFRSQGPIAPTVNGGVEGL